MNSCNNKSVCWHSCLIFSGNVIVYRPGMDHLFHKIQQKWKEWDNVCLKSLSVTSYIHIDIYTVVDNPFIQ